MEPNHSAIQLCIEGTQAEFKCWIEEAKALYQLAWQAARDDFEARVAAHYLARHQEDPEQKLRWNQVALDRANAVTDGRVQDFYPSLFLNMGQSYEMLGNRGEAQRYYDLAAKLGIVHQAD